MVDGSEPALISYAQVVQFEHGVAGLGGRLGHDQLDVSADHHCGQVGLAALGRRRPPHHSALAHDRNAVRDRQDLL